MTPVWWIALAVVVIALLVLIRLDAEGYIPDQLDGDEEY